MSPLRASAWITALFALFAGVVGLETALGQAARGASPPEPNVRVVASAHDALMAWQELKQSRHVMIHLGEYLQFEEPPEALSDRRLDRFPYPVASSLASGVTNRDLQWVLMRTSVARAVIDVVPPEVFAEKCRLTNCDQGEGEIRDAQEGLLRVIRPSLPSLEERVLVEVDASLFASPSGAALWREFVARGLNVDGVVFNLATDNEQVTELERDQLRAAARELEDGHAGPAP